MPLPVCGLQHVELVSASVGAVSVPAYRSRGVDNSTETLVRSLPHTALSRPALYCCRAHHVRGLPSPFCAQATVLAQSTVGAVDIAPCVSVAGVDVGTEAMESEVHGTCFPALAAAIPCKHRSHSRVSLADVVSCCHPP